MVDMSCFLICLAGFGFTCMFIGWTIGYADAKKKNKA